jgi:hypothetical protein
MPRGLWPLPDVADHNGEQWLVVKFCALLVQPNRSTKRRMLLEPGWYVVRTCPCHFGHRVSRFPCPTRARAEHVRQTILSVGGTP